MCAYLLQLSSKNIGKCTDTSLEISLRRFRRLFGVTPTIVATVWNISLENFISGTHEMHLLWALMMLKYYGTESVH